MQAPKAQVAALRAVSTYDIVHTGCEYPGPPGVTPQSQFAPGFAISGTTDYSCDKMGTDAAHIATFMFNNHQACSLLLCSVCSWPKAILTAAAALVILQ